MGFKKNSIITINKTITPLREIDRYKPDWDIIKSNIDKYYFQVSGISRVLPLLSSRGCPYNCGFCYNNYFNKSEWRGHSKEYIYEQIDVLKKIGKISGIRFFDDIPFCNLEQAEKVFTDIDIPWGVGIRPNQITEEFVQWVKKTKCFYIFLGAESGSQSVLNKIDKKCSVDAVKRAVSLLKNSNIHVRAGFLIGFPGETKEDIDETFNLIQQIDKGADNIDFSITKYIPYPGTSLWQKTLERGWEPPVTTQEWGDLMKSGFNYNVTECDYSDINYIFEACNKIINIII